MTQALLNWDTQALLFVQERLRADWLDPVARFVTALGNGGLLWIAIGIAFLLWKRTRRDSLFLLPTLAAATALNNLVIKNLVARTRPYELIPGLTILIAPERSWSFPSGHACSSFAVATGLFLAFRKRGGAWAYLPASLIALSRVYVGVHYLTDVLAGALVGTVMAIACYKLYRHILRRTSP